MRPCEIECNPKIETGTRIHTPKKKRQIFIQEAAHKLYHKNTHTIED